MISIGQGRKIERDDKMMEKMKIVVNIMTKKSLEAGVGDGGSNKGTPDAAYIYILSLCCN